MAGPRFVTQFALSEQLSEVFKHTDLKPGEPDALAFAAKSNAIKAVVPITSSDQRQPMRTGSGRARDGPPTMFEQRTLRGGSDRNGKTLGLLFLQWFAVEEWNHLIENRSVAGGANVMRGDERKPEKIVTEPRPDAGARLWMPPVLHIAFQELPCGRAQDVLASQVWRSVHESHDILQLVSKPVSAARLIKGRAAPDSAAEGLIKQPAVEQKVRGKRLRRWRDRENA